MGNIKFNDVSFDEAMEKMNTECKILQDIYDRFVNEVIVKSDKIDDFAIRAKELKDEIQRLQDKLVTLKMKGRAIERLYSDTENANRRLVNNLPDGRVAGAKVTRNGGAFPGPQIQNKYRVIDSTDAYTVNEKYDFEDWLVEWLSTGSHR